MARPKGSLNKQTGSVKRAIEIAFEGLGGAQALTNWAKRNPSDFYTKIWVKIIPANFHLTGEDGGPIAVKVVNFANDNPAA